MSSEGQGTREFGGCAHVQDARPRGLKAWKRRILVMRVDAGKCSLNLSFARLFPDYKLREVSTVLVVYGPSSRPFTVL